MRVLISAYACEPHRGSESGVGWNWALQAARFHEVWVLTRENNRDVIEAELRISPVPNLQFIYHDLPRWARSWKRSGRGLNIYYLLWQATGLARAMIEHSRWRFDLVHHLTFNSIDSPSFLWMLPATYVWGPIGGVQVPPESLRGYFEKAWPKERRRMLRKRLVRLNPIVRMGILRASCTLAATTEASRTLHQLGSRKVHLELEAGVNVSSLVGSTAPRRTQGKRVVIMWAGMLVHRKGPLLALDVMEQLKPIEPDIQLLIVGSGPLQGRLEREIKNRELHHIVRLVGGVSHKEMNNLYEQADIFLFTSLQDTSGNVVLEAMSQALPVVCLDHQGAAEMVSCEAGIKIPPASRHEVVTDLGSAIRRLAHDSTLREQMGTAAYERVRALYSWDRKGELLKQLYAEVVRQSA